MAENIAMIVIWRSVSLLTGPNMGGKTAVLKP